MAILAECPMCHRKQATKNKVCKCGKDLDQAKRSGRVKYWISYYMPDGKQRREPVGYSISEARDAEGKRKSQRRENRIFDMLPESKTTFKELFEWYLNLERVKALASYERINISLDKFNSILGDMVVGKIKPVDLENYQQEWRGNISDSTIDRDLDDVRTMINKAFYNDLIGAEPLKNFKRVKKLVKRGSNARDKILSLEQFNSLMDHLPLHAKGILATGFYTGMRLNEILTLTWEKVDFKAGFIRLDPEDTKDRERRFVPIPAPLERILKSIPRAIHTDRVFLYNGQPIKSMKRSLITACKNAGITYGRKVPGGFVFHDLRHSFNTHMRKAGVPESVIMKITGHSTREMFERYNTVDLEDTKQAVSQLEVFFESSDQSSDQEAKKG